VKQWPILIFLAHNIKKKLDVNDCSLAHLTLILSLHYLVKCWSRLAVYKHIHTGLHMSQLRKSLWPQNRSTVRILASFLAYIAYTKIFLITVTTNPWKCLKAEFFHRTDDYPFKHRSKWVAKWTYKNWINIKISALIGSIIPGEQNYLNADDILKSRRNKRPRPSVPMFLLTPDEIWTRIGLKLNTKYKVN